APGMDDGALTFWIDGVQQASLTGIDNDTRQIDQVRLGAVLGLDNGTRGAYYFDSFASTRTTYLGVDGIQAGFTASPTFGAPPLAVTFTNLTYPQDPANTYLWDFGDGQTSTDASPTHTYTGEGLYT